MRHWLGWWALAVMACGDKSGSELDKELDRFQGDANKVARMACNATSADVNGDGVSEAARCYFELAVEFEDCERAGLNAYPAQARLLLDCDSRDRTALIACCSEGGACTYERIEQCYEQLWDGDSGGACDVDTTGIDSAIDACEEREQNGSGTPHACSSDDPNC